MKNNSRRKRIKFRRHTKGRLIERYEVAFNDEDLKNMKKLIMLGKTKIIKALSNSRTIHEVFYKDLNILVIYNKQYKEIATALEHRSQEDTL